MYGDVYKRQNCPVPVCYNNVCGAQASYVYTLYQDCTDNNCNSGSCCTPQASSLCDVNDQKIYWYDSCDVKGAVKTTCSALNNEGAWSANYCKDGNVFHSRTVTYYGCSAGATACSVTKSEFQEEPVQTCTNGCTAGVCNAGCANAAECPTLSATGCSLDYVKRYTCVLAQCPTGGTFYNTSWMACTGGRCDPSTKQCVAGCTNNVNCDDNNACTSNVCTVSTGQCSYPADTTKNGVICSKDGVTGTCQNGVCTPTAQAVSLSLSPSTTTASVGQSFTLTATLSGVSAATSITIDGATVPCSLSGSTCSASVSRSKSSPGSYTFTASGGGKTASTSLTVGCSANTQWDGSTCAAACTDVCLDASAVACGQAVPSTACKTCTGTGTLCAEGSVCTSSGCQVTPYAISVEYAKTVLAGSYVGLAPRLLQGEKAVDAVWTYTGWMNSSSKGTSHLDLGQKSVGISASLPSTGLSSKQAVATTSISFKVVCNPGDPLYGPCCRNEVLVRDGSSSCTTSAKEQGVCTKDGQCVKYCAPAAKKGCQDKNLYWYDGCGNKGDLVQSCPEACAVVDGVAQCVEKPVVCTDPWTYACRGQEGVKEQCGVTQSVTTCSDKERCVADNNGVRCVAAPCGANQLQCGDRCVDPMISRTDCGRCNNACGPEAQCSLGTCEEIEGCFVVCDANVDCPVNHVCVNPGHCSLSVCKPLRIVTPVEDVTKLVTHEYIRFDLSVEKNALLVRLTNLAPVPLQEVAFTLTIPKVIAAHADKLQVGGASTEILDPDPVLRLTFPALEERRTITVQTDHLIDESYVADVAITDVSYTGLDASILLDKANETQQALQIGLNSEFDGEKTTLRLNLAPTKDLFGLTVPVEIPKCLAEYASELQLPENAVIIEEDPLIAWQFEQLDEPVEITFSVDKEIETECLDQLRALAYARKVGKPLSPWLSLLLIPVLGLAVIFAQRAHRSERLSKAQYVELARKQGMTDEAIEREWRDYERRFRGGGL